MDEFQDTSIVEYRAPLHSDGHEGFSAETLQQLQHGLRRATKRINQRELDDGGIREGKRPKFDPRSKGVSTNLT